MPALRIASAIALLATTASLAAAQTTDRTLKAGALTGALVVDGRLDERDWLSAPQANGFLQSDPREGAEPNGRTTVQVLASAAGLAIGIVCEDPEPNKLVSFSVRRDASLSSEDHVRIVLGPFADGRSGFVFSVNPSGARFDAVINPGGESSNADWDAIWDAATQRTPTGWAAEFWIPAHSLGFKAGLHEWQFNVERRVQRLLETSRWASPARQYQLTQTSRAGLLTDLPTFDLGLGLTIRPSVTTGGGIPTAGASVAGEFQPSLDVTKRLGPDVLASFTANTDFAETEVDTRRTNLTRFPLLFPEKRTFFLEGDDIFAFGLGLNEDVIPYFSRRIGLVSGTEVPILAGTKINGRLGSTNFGGLAVGTNDRSGVVEDQSVMAVARIKQNIWRESWAGLLATVGDPLHTEGSWTAGGDFTYATSRFRGDKNFLAGVWALATGRNDPGSDRSAVGFKLDYPNDEWDIALTYKRIGRDFDPSLGFVPRRAVQLYNLTFNNITRIERGPLQRLFHEFEPSLATSLGGDWESYRVFFAPVNWRFRSGDRFEFNVNPTGERLNATDEVAGVEISAGSYHWRRYRLEIGTAQKRRFYSQVTWWFGGFYDGSLDQVIWTGAWNPVPLITVEFSGERNAGRLKNGPIRQTLTGTRVRVNVSPDLSLASYVQYDTDTHLIGTNTRLRWTFLPVADLFVVYNHNVQSVLDRWKLESNQFLVKLQYSWRY